MQIALKAEIVRDATIILLFLLGFLTVFSELALLGSLSIVYNEIKLRTLTSSRILAMLEIFIALGALDKPRALNSLSIFAVPLGAFIRLARPTAPRLRRTSRKEVEGAFVIIPSFSILIQYCLALLGDFVLSRALFLRGFVNLFKY